MNTNTENAVDLSAVDFKVDRVPLQTIGSRIPVPMDAIIRRDTGEVLGQVSRTYNLLEHHTALRTAMQGIAQLPGEFAVKKLRLQDGGARMFAYIEGKQEFDFGTDSKGVRDVLRPTLILQNSIDGSTRFGFKVGALRLVCSNGMVAGVSVMNILIRHTSGADFGDILRSGGRALNSLTAETLPKWRDMVQTPVNYEFAIKMLSNKKLGIPDKVNKRVIELSREIDTSTLWDLYNRYTFHLTHEYKGTEDRRLFISGAVERVLSRYDNNVHGDLGAAAAAAEDII